MATSSDPTPSPATTPDPIGPEINPIPPETPLPEVTPGFPPSEAPENPAFPDNGRPYDAQV